MLFVSPKHRTSLWLLANSAWIAAVPAAASYFHRQLLVGAYPVDADSIGLPIIGIAVWVTFGLLPLNLAWWFLLRRYPGRVPLRTSDEGLATGSKIISVLGLICALSFAAAGVWAVADDALEIAPILVAWSYVALAMRASHLAAARQSLQA